MLTRCKVKHAICEHSKLYLELSPTACITTVGKYSRYALLVEVDSCLHHSAELRQDKPLARARSRPGLQWAKPVSDPV